jgi:PPM family protein phosphatase
VDAGPDEQATIAGTLKAEEVSAAAADAPTPTRAPTALRDAPADATVVRPPERRPAPAHRRRRRRVKTLVSVGVAVALLAGMVGGLYALSRQVYFVGTNDAGLVTLYRGVPYELPFGIDLYEEEYASGVPARAIPARRRERVLDHEWRGRADAVDLVRALERGELDTGAGQAARGASR